MVTKKVIQDIYSKYNKPPESPDELNLALLFDCALENYGIEIDGNDLCIASLGPSSPFSILPLDHIHEILDFDNYVAVVLPNSILFLNKLVSEINVHIRLEEPSIWSRLKSKFKW